MTHLFIYAIALVVTALFFKGICGVFIHLFDFIGSCFIHLRQCKCGEVVICLKYDEGKHSCICQNCYKKTAGYDYACQAKKAWNRGEYR